jgi:hypothetical protein
MITFNQLLFLALLVCTVGPIVWALITMLARATLQILIGRFFRNPTPANWNVLRSAAVSGKPGLDAKYSMLLLAHDQAEFLMLRMRGTPLGEHYDLLHTELCRQLAEEPAADVEQILNEQKRHDP